MGRGDFDEQQLYSNALAHQRISSAKPAPTTTDLFQNRSHPKRAYTRWLRLFPFVKQNVEQARTILQQAGISK